MPFGVAGIYCPWRHPDGRELLSFAMLTVNADDHPLMKRFHRPEDEKRMVVILDPEDYGNWLACRCRTRRRTSASGTSGGSVHPAAAAGAQG